MTNVVIDASTALAWCFPDESSDYADAVLVALEGKTILVPAVWSMEIANALLVGERKKRLRQPEILRFTNTLDKLLPTEWAAGVSGTAEALYPLLWIGFGEQGLPSLFDVIHEVAQLPDRHLAPHLPWEVKINNAWLCPRPVSVK